MMKQRCSLHIFLLVSILLLTACSKENMNDIGDDRVEFGTGGNENTADPPSPTGEERLAEGDIIGITMMKQGTNEIIEDADNRMYMFTSGNKLTPFIDSHTIYYPVNSSTVDFIAYCPYNQSGDNLGSVDIDVSNQSDQHAIDLLYTRATGYNKNSGTVNLVFDHSLCRLVIAVVAGQGFDDTNLEGLKIELKGMYTQARLNLIDGSLTDYSDIGDIPLKTSTDGKEAEGIILPAGTGSYSMVFTLRTGEEFVYTVPAGKEFKAGEQHEFTITIDHSGISVETSVKDWIAGNSGQEEISAQ